MLGYFSERDAEVTKRKLLSDVVLGGKYWGVVCVECVCVVGDCDGGGWKYQVLSVERVLV